MVHLNNTCEITIVIRTICILPTKVNWLNHYVVTITRTNKQLPNFQCLLSYFRFALRVFVKV